MAVTPTTSGTAPYASRKTAEPTQCEHTSSTARHTEEKPQGGERPSDFGHGGPDYNHDGTVSDAESKAYQADRRSADKKYETDKRTEERHFEAEKRAEERRYTTESRERIAHEKEQGKNYRAELQAKTAEMQNKNDNKLHKLFGFDFS